MAAGPCTACGATHGSDAMFCGVCGGPLPAPPALLRLGAATPSPSPSPPPGQYGYEYAHGLPDQHHNHHLHPDVDHHRRRRSGLVTLSASTSSDSATSSASGPDAADGRHVHSEHHEGGKQHYPRPVRADSLHAAANTVPDTDTGAVLMASASHAAWDQPLPSPSPSPPNALRARPTSSPLPVAGADSPSSQALTTEALLRLALDAGSLPVRPVTACGGVRPACSPHCAETEESRHGQRTRAATALEPLPRTLDDPRAAPHLLARLGALAHAHALADDTARQARAAAGAEHHDGGESVGTSSRQREVRHKRHSAPLFSQAGDIAHSALVHGVVSRTVAHSLLQAYPPGTFMLRAKSASAGLSLSVRDHECVRHYIVHDNGHGDDFCLVSLAAPAPHFSSLEALITHYSVTPLSGITLCAAVDHFRCLAALQATVPHSYDLFVAAIAAVTNLAEAVDLNDELTEAVRRGEVGSREAADLAERIAHVQKLYRHGVPTAAWVPDAAADTCMCCTSTRFGTLRRRHHCRNCGNIICSNCCRAGSISEDVQMDKLCKSCHGFFMRHVEPKRSPGSGLGPAFLRKNRRLRKLTGNEQTLQSLATG